MATQIQNALAEYNKRIESATKFKKGALAELKKKRKEAMKAVKKIDKDIDALKGKVKTRKPRTKKA